MKGKPSKEKAATSQPGDDRLLFAMYDAERSNKDLAKIIRELESSLETLSSQIEGFTSVCEDLTTALNRFSSQIESMKVEDGE